MRIYSVLPNIFGGQSVDQFGLTATAVYRFPSCPAAALPLIFKRKIHSSLCLQDNNADRAFDGAFLSGYSVSVRCNFAIAQKQSYPIPLTDAGRILIIIQRFFRSARTH